MLLPSWLPGTKLKLRICLHSLLKSQAHEFELSDKTSWQNLIHYLISNSYVKGCLCKKWSICSILLFPYTQTKTGTFGKLASRSLSTAPLDSLPLMIPLYYAV
jgi:hypothetical protein